MNNNGHGLLAPLVTIADSDGLITTANLESNVVIYIPAWDTAEEGDTNQLLIDGKLVGNPEYLLAPTSGETGMTTLTIPVVTELKHDGYYLIGYRATNIKGGVSADSAMTTIRIKRTIPGAAMLAPIIFPNATFGETLLGTIPGYAGMELGDSIQTMCNEMNGPTIIISSEHLTTAVVAITFQRDFMHNLDSKNITLSYQVTDRAGNVSKLSESIDLNLTI